MSRSLASEKAEQDDILLESSEHFSSLRLFVSLSDDETTKRQKYDENMKSLRRKTELLALGSREAEVGHPMP